MITIRDGQVYIDGKLLKEKYLKGAATPGEVTNLKIPKDCVFAMGDNRGNSLDSRDPKVGCVETDRILGKAFLRLYPFTDIKTF